MLQYIGPRLWGPNFRFRFALPATQNAPKVSIHILLWEFPALAKNYSKDAKQHRPRVTVRLTCRRLWRPPPSPFTMTYFAMQSTNQSARFVNGSELYKTENRLRYADRSRSRSSASRVVAFNPTYYQSSPWLGHSYLDSTLDFISIISCIISGFGFTGVCVFTSCPFVFDTGRDYVRSEELSRRLDQAECWWTNVCDDKDDTVPRPQVIFVSTLSRWRRLGVWQGKARQICSLVEKFTTILNGRVSRVRVTLTTYGYPLRLVGYDFRILSPVGTYIELYYYFSVF